MNIAVDIIIALIVIIFTFIGWKNGFFKMLPGIINVAAALVAASLLCSAVGKLWPLHESELIAKIIAFVIVFILTLFAMKFLRFILDKICDKTLLKLPNKILGTALGLLLGLFYAWTFSTLLASSLPLLTKYFPDLFSSELLEKSVLFELFYDFNPLTAIKLFK